jgi:hypothetical protein
MAGGVTPRSKIYLRPSFSREMGSHTFNIFYAFILASCKKLEFLYGHVVLMSTLCGC